MEAESGQSNNRLFILLAVAMVGLICIGLVGLTAATFFIVNNRAQESAAVTPTFTPVLPTFTPTGTPTPTPTNTPLPTPTSTPVVKPEQGEEAGEQPPAAPTATVNPNATPTNTRVIQPTETATLTPTEPAEMEMPDSGGVLPPRTGYLSWVGVGLLLMLLAGAFYRLRSGLHQ